MGLRSRISRLRLNSKLLLANIVIALAFGLVAAFVIFSFRHIQDMASQVALTDLRAVAANTRESQYLSELLNDVTRVAYSFHGNNDFLTEKRIEVGRFMDTLVAAATPEMQKPLDTLQAQINTVFERCGAVNGILLSWKTVDHRLDNDIEKLRHTMSDVALDMHRTTKDPSVIDRFASLAISVRATLLETEKTFATLPHSHFFTPHQENRSPVLDLLDNLELKLQVLPTYRQEMIREIKILRNILNDARNIVKAYYRAMAQLAAQLNALEQTKSTVIAALENENRELTASAELIPKRIASSVLVTVVVFLILSLAVMAGLMLFMARLVRSNVQTPLKQTITAFENFGKGQRDARLDLQRHDDWAEIESNLNKIFDSLRGEDWLRTGKTELENRLRGNQRTRDMAPLCLSFLAKRLEAQIGALYLTENDHTLVRRGGYGISDHEAAFEHFEFGEGFVGQAALESKTLHCTAGTYPLPLVDYGPDSTHLRHYAAAPLLAEERVVGVLLLGSNAPFTPLKLQFIEQCLESIAVAFLSSTARRRINDLLEETQRQTLTLAQQQEELKNAYEELAQQAKILRESEMSLQTQQEELRVANEELANQTQALRASEQRLQAQQEELRQANKELGDMNVRLEDKVLERTKDLALKAEELETANHRLLELDQMKSAFLSSVSHELRTPLTSVLGFAKLIRRDLTKSFWPLAEGDKRLERRRKIIKDNLGIIEHEGDRLSRLINDVLDLNKIESGHMDWRDAEIDPGEIVTRVVQAVTGQLAEKTQLEIKVAIDQELSTIWADADRLEQVLLNLVGNAVKFTMVGYVAIRAFTASNGWAQIEVEDTGPGIPEEDAGKIFDKFHQVRVRDTLSEKPAGTGLGLAICREIVDHYSGRIWVRSELGKGSIFFLQFAPFRQQNIETAPPAPIPTPRLEDDALRPLALVIEDEPHINELIRQLLEAEGYQAVGAYSAEEGLVLAKEIKPACITMDLMLPGLDGKAAIALLKQDPELAGIPVLVISALGERDAAGGDAALAKPIDEQRLLATIRGLLGRPAHDAPALMLRRETEHSGNGDPAFYLGGAPIDDYSPDELWERIEAGFKGTVVIPAEAIASFDLKRLGDRKGVQILVVP